MRVSWIIVLGIKKGLSGYPDRPLCVYEQTLYMGERFCKTQMTRPTVRASISEAGMVRSEYFSFSALSRKVSPCMKTRRMVNP